MSRLIRAAAATALACGSVLALSVPAQAAPTPTCSRSVTYQGALVPAASNGSVSCNMIRGNVSDGVARLQDTLNDCYPSQLRGIGVFPLSIDRDFGGNTYRALRAVQGAVGARVDGQYGPETRSKMKHVDPDFGDPCRRVS